MYTRFDASTIACMILTLEDALAEYIQAEADVTIDSDGIGSYEFWGHKGFDAGKQHASVESGDVTVRLAVADVLLYVDVESVSDLKPEHFLDGFTVSDYFGGDDDHDGLEWTVKVTIKSINVVGENIHLSIEWSQS